MNLSGRTQDKNLAVIAKGLNDMGIRMMAAHVIPDVREKLSTLLILYVLNMIMFSRLAGLAHPR